MVADGADEEAARRLAARLTEHLARSGLSAVVEATTDDAGRPAVELRWFGQAPERRATSVQHFRWTVQPERAESQFRDIARRIELLRVAPPRPASEVPTEASPAWCQWE